MDRKTLSHAVRLVLLSYIFLNLDFNLGTINILPDWFGYVLILKVLPDLSEAVPSAHLLRPLGILLAVWEGCLWIFTSTTGEALTLYIVTVISSVIGLYFHFQLLTNLAEIAKKFDSAREKPMLHLRTARTILITVFALPIPWERWEVLSGGLIAVNLIVTIWLCSTLFSLYRELEKEPVMEE